MAIKVTTRDTGFKDFMGSFRNLGGYTISAGVHEEEANQTHQPSGLPIGAISVIHEFGAPAANIPARPHIRPTFDENHRRYQREITKASEATLRRRGRPQRAYEAVAEGMRSDIEKRMRAGIVGQAGAGADVLSIGKSSTLIDTEDYLSHIKGKAKK